MSTVASYVVYVDDAFFVCYVDYATFITSISKIK